MKHLDLFSGIGGFAYAVDEIWENAEHIFCDNDKFCREVLKKHWTNSKIYEDIKEIKSIADTRSEKQRRLSDGERESLSPIREGDIDLLTGGFPCQPFSQAGKRRGTEDTRYLWPEMLRVIQLTKSKWVIAENVRGLLTQQGGLVFEQVCADLEASGYEVQPFIIPAVAVNAPHRRNRVWIVAYRNDTRSGTPTGKIDRNGKKKVKVGNKSFSWFGRQCADVTQSESGQSGQSSEQKGREDFERGSWERNWLEVATELCGVDDGLSAELDGFKLTKAGHRIQRLKSLGNAIVPQVAMEIMKIIKSCQTKD